MRAESIRLKIGNLANAVLVTGQAYQDPKDALNEFVSNAADEYAEAERRGERIRVVLRRKGKRPMLAVEDTGRGMTPDRLRDLARNLFESAKAGDPRTIGEKAIGILAFQQLGSRCDVFSRTADSPDTFVLRLERGKATAKLERSERHRARQQPGTTVVVSDLDPDVSRVLTQRKVVDYLRRRRGPALQRGDYTIEVAEGRSIELVTPEQPDGVRLEISPRHTLWGRIEFAIYVAPESDRRRRVAVVGRAGTTIIEDICEIEELDCQPWSTDQVSGVIAFDALQQTAGRRAVLRDREAFPVFVEAVRSVEPAVARTLERVAREVDAQAADRLAEVVRRIFGKVLRELDDVDNPMRTLLGTVEGDGGLLASSAAGREAVSQPAPQPAPQPADVDEPDVFPPPSDPASPVDAVSPTASPGPGRSRNLPTVAPDPNPDGVRSRYDPDDRIVYYNEQHPDYLLVKSDETSLLDYLSTLVAKELVVYNNPRAPTGELAEEMVRMLVRVRRHLPRRR